jgi:uncharacterized repeat protein (TIGR01451 family)
MKKSKSKRLFTLFIFFSILGAFSIQYVNRIGEVKGQSVQNIDWYIQTIDQPNKFNAIANYSMELDSSWQPHIVYIHSDGAMYYGSQNGAIWQKQLITTIDDAYQPALAFDTLDNPHIAFIDNGILKYAYRSGNNWIIQTVDSEVSTFPSLSLVLDANNNPHISYAFNDQNETVDGFPFAVKYAYWSGTDWEIQIIEQGVSKGVNNTARGGTSIAIDSMGTPIISYILNPISFVLNPLNFSILKYARKVGNGWDIEVIEQRQVFSELDRILTSPSLTLDANDNLYIVYQRTYYTDFGIYDYEIIYSQQVTGTWESQVVTSGATMSKSSFVLDNAGNPHISFSSASPYGVFYAQILEDNWTVERVSLQRGITSMALDENNNAHISFYSNDSGKLMYAGQFLPLELSKTAFPQNEVANGEIVTYTLKFSGPNHTAILIDQLPDGIEYVPNSITPPAIYSPTIRSIIWEGVVTIDPVQEVSFNATVVTDTVEYPVIVNTALLTDQDYEDKSVSSVSIVNGWEIFLPIVSKSP